MATPYTNRAPAPRRRVCQSSGCPTTASFARIGDKRATHCKKHSTSDMVTTHPLCGFEGCATRPTYGQPGAKPLRCVKHAEAGMVDVTHSEACLAPGCTKRPHFGLPNHRASHCKAHSLEGMVNVVSKPCRHEGCATLPTFAVAGSKGATHCSAHKAAGMVDVINRQCEEEGCSVQPRYALPDEARPRRCATHKLPGMFNVVGRVCGVEGCSTTPNFALPHEKQGRCCKAHALAGMVDIVNARCVVCNLFQVRRKQDACWTCRCGRAASQRIELELRGMLDRDDVLRHYSSHDAAHPCARAMGIRNVRADVCWELPAWALLLEIDEEEHRLYEPSCEQARIHELHELVGKAMLLVRYNPHHAGTKSSLGNKRPRDALERQLHDHGGLLLLLKQLLASEGRVSVSEATSGLSVSVRGHDQLRVVYVGYTSERIDQLWEFTARQYGNVNSSP